MRHNIHSWIYHHRHKAMVTSTATVSTGLALKLLLYITTALYTYVKSNHIQLSPTYVGTNISTYISAKFQKFKDVSTGAKMRYILMTIALTIIIVNAIVAGWLVTGLTAIYDWLLDFPGIVAIRYFIMVVESDPHRWPNWLPGQTRVNVLLFYCLLSWLNLVIANVKIFCKHRLTNRHIIKNTINDIVFTVWSAIWYIFLSMMSLTTVLAMISGKYPIKWHHMSYGIVMAMTGYTFLSGIGFILIIDSCAYFGADDSDTNDYGFDNILEQYMGLYLILMVVMTILEKYVHDRCSRVFHDNHVFQDSQQPIYSTLNVGMTILHEDSDDVDEPLILDM
jgi:MFS family permease